MPSTPSMPSSNCNIETPNNKVNTSDYYQICQVEGKSYYGTHILIEGPLEVVFQEIVVLVVESVDMTTDHPIKQLKIYKTKRNQPGPNYDQGSVNVQVKRK